MSGHTLDSLSGSQHMQLSVVTYMARRQRHSNDVLVHFATMNILNMTFSISIGNSMFFSFLFTNRLHWCQCQCTHSCVRCSLNQPNSIIPHSWRHMTTAIIATWLRLCPDTLPSSPSYINGQTLILQGREEVLWNHYQQSSERNNHHWPSTNF